NVYQPDGNFELLEADRQKNIDPSTHLYFGNISPVLPGKDSDLVFNLSSLPAPVGGSISPARLTSPAAFKRTMSLGGDEGRSSYPYVPSAVAVSSLVQVGNYFDKKRIRHCLAVINVAAAHGASPRQ